MSEDLKALRDEAKAALEVINEKSAKLDDVVDRDTFEKANAAFDTKYEQWESAQKELTAKSAAAEKRADALEARLAKINTNESKGNGRSEVEQKQADAFVSWARKGDEARLAEVMEGKRLSTDNDAQGGYLVAPEFIDAEISRIVSETSPVRQFASVQSIGSEAYKKNVNVGGSAARWRSNQGDEGAATAEPSFREVRIPAHELEALYSATSVQLADSRVSIERLFSDEMGIAIAELESPAFVSGDGVGKPRGFLSYTNTISNSYNGSWESVEYYKTGAAGAFKAAGSGPEEVFIDTIHSLKNQYRTNARFYLNRGTLGEVRKIKDADGRPIFMWDGTMPATIAGEPYTLFEDMPDVADDAYAIAYGDLRAAYQIVDRAGLSVMRDPYSSKPNVEFYGLKRVGGGMKMFEALKLIRFAD
jgi:HK97 family phage major capsid protein